MSRPISMRVSYREDASYLLRLETAVLKDVSQSEGWRKIGASLSRQLSLHLLKADKSKCRSVSPKSNVD
jgi:hypothetical protein